MIAAAQADPPTAAPPTDLNRVRRDSARGGAISAASRLASVVIKLASTVVLARVLTPADYGVIAMVGAATAFVALFRDLGLSTASIQQRGLTHAQQSNLFWINVAVGLGLTALTAAAAPLVAAFYGEPALGSVTVAMSPVFVLGSIASQPYASMARAMQFGRQAISDLASAVMVLGVSLALGLAGWGYWALVAGTLAGASAAAIASLALSPFRPGLPVRGASVGEMVGFGANLVAFAVVDYFHRQLDNVLIGRAWGADALGVYSRAYALLMVPVQAIRGPLAQVAFPALSRLRDQPDAFRAYVRELSGLVALGCAPAFLFAVVSAEPLIETLLGSRWQAAATPFAWLALAGIVQPIMGVRAQVLLSLGRSDRFRNWGLINAAVVTIAFLVAAPWGPDWVARAYGLTSLALFVPSVAYATHGTFVALTDVTRPIVLPIVAGAIAAAAVVGSTAWLLPAEGLAPPARLLANGGVFAAVVLAVYGALPSGRAALSLLSRRLARLLSTVTASRVSR